MLVTIWPGCDSVAVSHAEHDLFNDTGVYIPATTLYRGVLNLLPLNAFVTVWCNETGTERLC